MFNIITIEDTVRISPENFNKDLMVSTTEELKSNYEGIVSKELGFVIALIDAKVDPQGKIIPGDASTHHKVTFTLLSYYPAVQEIVEGEVVEVADFGAFVRIGPIDALLHVSQIIDDFITYNERQGELNAKETGRVLRQNDFIRARVTVVSFTKGKSSGKIGLTTRQPFLGKIDWIKKEVEKITGNTKKLEGKKNG